MTPLFGVKTAAFLAVLEFCLAPPTQAFAQGREQTRSLVMTRYGIVASEHPLASQIGAQVLADEGNAVDPAVAVNAALGRVN